MLLMAAITAAFVGIFDAAYAAPGTMPTLRRPAHMAATNRMELLMFPLSAVFGEGTVSPPSGRHGIRQ